MTRGEMAGRRDGIAIAEIKFQSNGQPVSTSGVKATCPTGPNAALQTSPQKAIDNDDHTVFRDPDHGALTLEFPAPVVIDEFSITTAVGVTGGDMASNDPVAFKLHGSDDGQAWTMVHQTIDVKASAERIKPGGKPSKFYNCKEPWRKHAEEEAEKLIKEGKPSQEVAPKVKEECEKKVPELLKSNAECMKAGARQVMGTAETCAEFCGGVFTFEGSLGETGTCYCADAKSTTECEAVKDTDVLQQHHLFGVCEKPKPKDIAVVVGIETGKAAIKEKKLPGECAGAAAEAAKAVDPDAVDDTTVQAIVSEVAKEAAVEEGMPAGAAAKAAGDAVRAQGGSEEDAEAAEVQVAAEAAKEEAPQKVAHEAGKAAKDAGASDEDAAAVAAEAATQVAIAEGLPTDDVINEAVKAAQEHDPSPATVHKAAEEAAGDAAVADGKSPEEAGEAAVEAVTDVDTSPATIEEAKDKAEEAVKEEVEKQRTENPVNNGGKGEVRIVAISKGFQDGNAAEILIDGKPAPGIKTRRGFNFVVLEDNGNMVDFKHFDTFGNAGAATMMETFLNGIPEGRVIITTVKDEASKRLTPSAKQALKRAGATDEIDHLGFRDSYACIGVKGGGAIVEGFSKKTKGPVRIATTLEPACAKLVEDAKVALVGGKANTYCSDTGGGVRCNVDAAGPMEMFTIKTMPGASCQVALKGGSQGKFCKVSRDNSIKCESNTVGAWEMFRVMPAAGGKIALKSSWTKKFCTDKGGNGVVCDSDKVDEAASYRTECVEGCPTPAVLKFPMDFYFGAYMPVQRFKGILDEGTGFSEHNKGTYGWTCDGNSAVDYRAGKSGLTVGCSNGKIAFDSAGTCKAGDEYLPVNWELRVPNGFYNVEVDFGCAADGSFDGCMVEGEMVCQNMPQGACCKYNSKVEVTDLRFTVTGFNKGAKKCDSLSRVTIKEA
eukprot:TRINITY_DN6478_c0_g2_i4.p1 TRINITY_DN6478_c0_g2~~TRINITY_DN6478_c0_g2_i4.p1  ORF type:complete len:941 (+),score=349.61 TRINITY_DN6478_c0_g2_i4:1122-3944(+)